MINWLLGQDCDLLTRQDVGQDSIVGDVDHARGAMFKGPIAPSPRGADTSTVLPR